jgi:hydrogenase small subunit
MADETVYEHLRGQGLSRRDFFKLSGLLAVAIGLHNVPPVEASPPPGPHGAAGPADGLPNHLDKALTDPAKLVARALASKPFVPVIWLEFQDCAGCSEALTRSHSPTLVDLVLNQISVNYHETLMVAAGAQAEGAKQDAIKKYAGQYALVVEGGIPLGDNGIYCTVGGRTALDLLREAAAGAAAIVATGNCAAYGGIQKANPNPTGARGTWEVITDKPVVNIPGCPAIPEVFTGTLAQFLVFGTLPELDALNRPKTFYGTTLHDRCLRRGFYEAGLFANSFDDEGARQGWCLYKLGCKGPTTYNACAAIKWDAGLSWPVQSGHPCLGCSEPNFWDGGGFYQGQSAPLNRPALTAVGAAVGAGVVLGAGLAVANRAQKKSAASEE